MRPLCCGRASTVSLNLASAGQASSFLVFRPPPCRCPRRSPAVFPFNSVRRGHVSSIAPRECSGGTAVRTDFFSRWRYCLSHSSTADYKTQRDRAVLLTSVTEITVSARHLPSQARASRLCCAAIAKCAPSLPPPRSFACSGLRAAAVRVKTVRVFTDSLSAAA